MHATGFDRWYTLSPLNIIIGPNGGGKSTVIDLLRSLSSSNLWGSLPRENYPGKNFSGFDIEGDSFKIKTRFYPASGKVLSHIALTLKAETSNLRPILFHTELPKFSTSTKYTDSLFEEIISTYIGIQVRYLPASGPILAQELSDTKLFELLNDLSSYFPSIESKDEDKQAFHLVRPGELAILFKDDPSQHSIVHRDFLPLGWLQLVSILSFLRDSQEGALVLLDEPDRHLHPTFQRILLNLISSEIAAKKIQVILTTHSSTLLNPELLETHKAQLFVATRDRFTLLDDARHLLDDLGVKSSDLVQSNGIIWTEGPSDRIYIKTWLELYAKENNLPQFFEDIHYSIVPYGGALIKHLSFSKHTPNQVNLDALNHNWFIHIDSDLRNENHSLQKEKQRILAEAESINRKTNVWITQGYTMEYYLPAPFDKKVIQEKNGTITITCSKVELAQQFRKNITAWSKSFKKGTDLPLHIKNLYYIIESWQLSPIV